MNLRRRLIYTAIFFKDLFYSRQIIAALAIRDIEQKYKGSFLGILWLVLQPLLFLTMIYYVIRIGLRVAPDTSEVPYYIYLFCGYVCWIYISETAISATRAITEHAFLVKNVDFRLSTLPIVRIISASAPHIFFIAAAIIVAWFYGYPPSLMTLQLLYYFFSLSILLLGISWLTASSSLFVKDIEKIVSVFVRLGFWFTPVIWSIKNVPSEYHWIVKINPFYYIIEGYRDSIINKIGVWERIDEAIYFWVFTLVALVVGSAVFRKLRPYFSEQV